MIEAEAFEFVIVVLFLIIFLLGVIEGVVVLKEVDFVVLAQEGTDELLFAVDGLGQYVIFLLQLIVVLLGLTTF